MAEGGLVMTKVDNYRTLVWEGNNLLKNLIKLPFVHSRKKVEEFDLNFNNSLSKQFFIKSDKEGIRQRTSIGENYKLEINTRDPENIRFGTETRSFFKRQRDFYNKHKLFRRNILHEENPSDSDDPHHDNTPNSITKLLTVADFNGDGEVDRNDIDDIISRYNSTKGDDLYHPLYDRDADGDIDVDDIIEAVGTLGSDVPLIDQQIAQVTQATMQYYGSNGQDQALADGYIPFTQEVKGHGIHYYNPTLASEIGNLEELDLMNLKRPVGLNYDAQGNLIALFYIRTPQRQETTPDNPLGELFVKEEDDHPPAVSFDTLTTEDWHTHRSAWATGIGNLNSESVYFEEDVRVTDILKRLQDTNFQLFPESDKDYSPKFWMLHGWFHSFNPNGTFAITNPNVGIYAPQELGVHGGHHQGHEGENDPLIAGTDESELLFGTDEDDRINSFGGNDVVIGGSGNDLIWGSGGNDLLNGDDSNSSIGGDDMVYGGPGSDIIKGQGGDDRLFGGTEDDIIGGGAGDDLLRGGIGFDILTGGQDADSFVLAPTEGMDTITDLELEVDTIVLYGGITTEDISIDPIGMNTLLSFNNEPLAFITSVKASDLIAASDDVFLVA